jgi:hypothetical protein
LARFLDHFPLALGLPVIAFVQRMSPVSRPADIRMRLGRHFTPLRSSPRGAWRRRPAETHRAGLRACYDRAQIVDVPVLTKPPRGVMESDRATRDQVTGLRFVGS